MKIYLGLTRRHLSAAPLSPCLWLMHNFTYFVAAIALSTPHAIAQTPTPGPREVPAKTVPVPDTVSPQMQKLIAAPLTPTWNVIPKTPEEWKRSARLGREALTRPRA